MSQGKIWKYGDNVNTDVIFPGKHTYSPMEPEEMAAHALEDLDPEFAGKVQRGDFVVAGRNFGCGSSREQAAVCLKYAGVQAVIAGSFARIFFRNAINQGLPVIQCPDLAEHVETGDVIDLDLEKGVIKSGEKEFFFPQLPDSVRGILKEGGLIPFTRKRLQKKK
ncbi:MAG: 3-isopropylmalate dehydratase small subunit [Candidatus Aminicenantes bacterium]